MDDDDLTFPFLFLLSSLSNKALGLRGMGGMTRLATFAYCSHHSVCMYLCSTHKRRGGEKAGGNRRSGVWAG